MKELWNQALRKYPITKFLIKLVVAEWIVIIVELIVPQWFYRWH